MTSNPKTIACAIAFVVLLLGCTRTAPEATRPLEPSSAPAATPSPSGVVGGDTCLSSMPVYPGSKEEPEMRGKLEDWVRSMEVMSQASGAEVKVYSTGDTPGEVAQFYRKNPPPGAWERTLDQTAPEEVGFIVWEKSDLSAQMFTGVEGQRTLILLGCGPKLDSGAAPTVPTYTEGDGLADDGGTAVAEDVSI